jgi:hypothetical protein
LGQGPSAIPGQIAGSDQAGAGTTNGLPGSIPTVPYPQTAGGIGGANFDGAHSPWNGNVIASIPPPSQPQTGPALLLLAASGAAAGVGFVRRRLRR